jgi:hypothetical protein
VKNGRAILPVDLAGAVEELVSDLVAGRFREIEVSGRSGRLTADGISREIASYGRTLVRLPDDWQGFASTYGPAPGDIRSMDVALWTVEEGRSDLTLQLDVRRGQGGWSLEITDLHVL